MDDDMRSEIVLNYEDEGEDVVQREEDVVQRVVKLTTDETFALYNKGMTNRWTSTEVIVLNHGISVHGIDNWNEIKRDIRYGPFLLKRTARELFEKYNFDMGCIKVAAVFADTQVHSKLLRGFASPLLPLDQEFFVDDGLPIQPWWHRIWQPPEVGDDVGDEVGVGDLGEHRVAELGVGEHRVAELGVGEQGGYQRDQQQQEDDEEDDDDDDDDDDEHGIKDFHAGELRKIRDLTGILRKINALKAKICTENVRYQGYLAAIDQANGAEIEGLRADALHQIQNLENISIEFTLLDAELTLKQTDLGLQL